MDGFFPQAIGDEYDRYREEEVSEYLEKEDEAPIRTSGEAEIDETEDEKVKQSVEYDGERREYHFLFFRSQSDVFVDCVGDGERYEVWSVPCSGLIVETDTIVLQEHEERENDETEKLEKIRGHNGRVND